jgi:NAD(P)-dependent dehydrogenase (short-subunit alcohol dehydrogenase family)
MNHDEIKSTPQAPIHTGISPQATAREVLDKHNLRGKTAIVTGGYSGIGLQTTRALANAGSTVVIPARVVEKAQAALAGIPNLEFDTLDLMDQPSIDAFAHRFLAAGRPLHILINNAGILGVPLRRDARGNESMFSTNHLGHFQLTARLWPALKKANGARVVALSSYSHHAGGFDFDDPNFERREYNKRQAYSQSKTAAALFAVALDKRGRTQNIRAFAVHPGFIPDTNLDRSVPIGERMPRLVRDENGQIISNLDGMLFKTVEQGAATTIWCATSEQLNGMGGVYCENLNIARAVPADQKKGPGVWPWAIDPDLAERLWQLSENLTGVKFVI